MNFEFVGGVVAAVVGAGVGYFVYLGVKKGWSYAATKLGNWWNAATNDLKKAVSDIETRVTALEKKSAPAAKPTAPTPPAAAAPAAAAATVQSPNSNG